MSEQVIYPGRDLEAMSFAVNYHRWILEIFSPYLGDHLAEIGAGTGAFSELLLERRAASLSVVEPSTAMYQMLKGHIERIETPTKVKTYNALFSNVADEIKQQQQPDSIIYVNVMEHIQDDMAELDAVWRTLERGGRLFLFVPAIPGLYGAFDREVGHFRRYMKAELEEKCRRAGFKVLQSTYFDLIGVVPWWVKYCLFNSSTLEAGAVKLYDKYVVCIAKAIESVFKPPIGKNVLLVAEKT
jgi:SAM-dependent methyltransferase